MAFSTYGWQSTSDGATDADGTLANVSQNVSKPKSGDCVKLDRMYLKENK